MTRQLYSQTPIGDDLEIVTPSQMLRRAAEYLGEGPQRWTKGELHDGDAACALGAIEIVLEGKMVVVWDYEQAEMALIRTLKDMHPELTANTIPDLNDDPAVTYEDVLAAFEKTAIQFEEVGK